MEKTVWLYDIYCDSLEQGNLVGTEGGMEFSSKEIAIKDAEEYIKNSLMEEYGKEFKDFRIEVYEGREQQIKQAFQGK